MADVDLGEKQVVSLNNLNDRKNLLCGVVEGFYGRPWTPEQRKDLFFKQQKWGMNCYVYAPKDDYKHRGYWREMYTVEEAEHLRSLINEAKMHNIIFYYAISPGLDITYSSQKELAALKRKLKQVQQLGCNAFAVLFDDIHPEMSCADKEVFHSFAHAQVSVTNEIFTYLGQPRFMFCPTQYCSTRAVPSVQTSEYLTTLGSKLAPEIDILWTGPKVISKVLTVEHIREVTDVLKRPPVIWDNLHANDYDQSRLFLGPYCGRSPELIKLVRGVVANPNCEYGPNFIAIHTLAQWSRSSCETLCDSNEAVSADIRLETEGDDSNDECPSGLSVNTYHPRRALRIALKEWLEEFDRPVDMFGPIQQPQIPTPVPILPSVNTCMSLTSTTVAGVQPSLQPTSNINLMDTTAQENGVVTNPVMNSLLSESKVVVESTNAEEAESVCTDSSPSVSSGMELMDCNPSPSSSPCRVEDTMVIENKAEEDDGESFHSPNSDEAVILTQLNGTSDTLVDNSVINHKDSLSVEDLQLLADLFYLPFEHGKIGLTFMSEFNWLKMNSHLVINYRKSGSEILKPEVKEWYDRAEKFNELTQSVKDMCDTLSLTKNRSLLYDLYPYIWDMRGVISLLNSCINWLALGQVSSMVGNYVHGNYTWFSKGWREAFMSGDQEPWVFRGGLTAELQRLIPVDASNDLFAYKSPDVPLSRTYIIRPYLPIDRDKLYSLVLQTADGNTTYTAHPDLKGDFVVGCYLEALNDVIIMVVEDDTSELVGYCLAANATNQVARQSNYLSKIREKYPKVIKEEGVLLTPCEELLAKLHEEPVTPPESLVVTYPAVITFNFLPSLSDDSVAKRLITCIFASLRAQGIFGGHVCVKDSDKITLELCNRLGFLEITSEGELHYLGRSF